MGHEYCGYVEEVGSDVTSIEKGQFVIGSFATSDNTCPHCNFGYPSSCAQREFISRAQAPYLRVPLADGTLVATREAPPEDMLASLLTTSDVLGTGWFAADAAHVEPGATVVVVGDGAVGLLGVLSAKQMGAERIIAMSRHESRQELARTFGATDISSPSLPVGSDPARTRWCNRPRQGLRPDASARAGRRGLPCDGRAACDQGAVAAMSKSA